MNTYGERLKRARLKRGYTQEQLGELCGITKRSIISLENNQSNPKNSTTEKLAAALNVSTDYLNCLTDGTEEEFEDIKEQIANTLFAGGEYTDEDKEKFFAAFTKAYETCRKKAKKRAEGKL